MDRLTQMTVYAKVVEEGSFTKAANELKVAKSTVSRHVTELEQRLGVRLLNRTTRVVKPTDVGRAYYQRCAALIADAEEADRIVRDEAGAPRGLLRIASAPPFAHPYLMDEVLRFCQRYPQIEVDLVLEERLVHIVEESIDIAIRISRMTDSSLVARRLGTSDQLLCASPEYLQARGTPGNPLELQDHECVRRTVGDGATWTLSSPDGPIAVPVQGRFRSNDGEALLRAVLSGMGIGYLPDFMVRPHLEAGRLVPVLREYTPDARPVFALYPHRRLLSPRVRLFIDFLVDAWADREPWRCT